MIEWRRLKNIFKTKEFFKKKKKEEIKKKIIQYFLIYNILYVTFTSE